MQDDFKQISVSCSKALLFLCCFLFHYSQSKKKKQQHEIIQYLQLAKNEISTRTNASVSF